MWLSRTRIRTDGLYVSRNTYIRTGVAEWKITNPVHIIIRRGVISSRLIMNGAGCRDNFILLQAVMAFMAYYIFPCFESLPQWNKKGFIALLHYFAEFLVKVTDIYDGGDYLILGMTDRQSAFDRILASIPFKVQAMSNQKNLKVKLWLGTYVLPFLPKLNVWSGCFCSRWSS